MVDKERLVHERWIAQRREQVRALITDELLTEHQANPVGHTSLPLGAVIQYFPWGSTPGAEGYVGVAIRPWVDYRIGVWSKVDGEVKLVIEEAQFPTEEAVLHEIFLRKVHELIEV